MNLDHYLVKTSNLKRSMKFYTEIVGLKEGYCPFEGYPAVWLYNTDDHPLVHLLETDDASETQTGAVDHIAFRVAEINPVIKCLEKYRVEYNDLPTPIQGAIQIQCRDPDGILVEFYYEAGG